MKKLYILLLLNLPFFNLFAQQTAMPAKCTNSGGGIIVSGTSFTVSPEFGCLDFTNSSATTYVTNPVTQSGGALTNLGYIFNFKDGDNITFPATLQTSKTFTNPGTYWILQGGNSAGVAYISCKTFEAIQTEVPDFAVTTCGSKSITITFLDTPKNKKHGKYRVVWGDGGQSFTAQINVWPYQMQHTYAATPTVMPQIVAVYTRGASNFAVCNSEPISFPLLPINNPRISELEGLNGGTSAKITLSGGLDGNPYSIQQKVKDGSWVYTDQKIARNKGASFAQQTIDSLKTPNQYCFRLQAKDACGNEIFSNEVCTIQPTATILSDREVKLDWNIPDSDLINTPNIIRYSVGYSEFPSGANINTGTPVPSTGTTYIFSALDCSKKYNFNITAFLGTTESDKVVIKSPNVLVDPSTIKELPSPNEPGVVSVLNSRNLKYNIFESSGRLSKQKYIIYRSINGNIFEKIAETTNNFYDDNDLDLEKNQYCYAYKYENECGVQSALAINKPCNIRLSIENTVLKWTPSLFDNKSAIVSEYFVNLLYENGSILRSPLGSTIETFYDISPAFAIEPVKTLKFQILGRVKYFINVGNVSTPFTFSLNSNIITYSPILSTSNESEILNIYPNPSEEIIQLNSTFQLKIAEIVDLQGKTIESQVIEDNQVSVKNLQKGKYILRLYNQERQLIVNKMIVKM